jgi:F-type H+-transporting ATPase subunit epsilon
MAAAVANKLRLRVVTPEKTKFDGDAEMVIMRCMTGDMGILPRHEPCSATLDDGILRLMDAGEERRMAVFGGLVQVRDDVVTILTGDAQWPEDIDRARVEAERAAAERELREGADTVQLQKDHVTMRRTLVLTEVSTYPLINRPAAGKDDEAKQ